MKIRTWRFKPVKIGEKPDVTVITSKTEIREPESRRGGYARTPIESCRNMFGDRIDERSYITRIQVRGRLKIVYIKIKMISKNMFRIKTKTIETNII